MTVDEFLQFLNDQLEKGKEKGGGEDEAKYSCMAVGDT